jgi:predicted Zn-dependent protease
MASKPISDFRKMAYKESMNQLRSLSLILLGLGIGMMLGSRLSIRALPASEAQVDLRTPETQPQAQNQDQTSDLSTPPTSTTLPAPKDSVAVSSSVNTQTLQDEFQQYLVSGDFDKANQSLAQLSKADPHSKIFLEGQVDLAMRQQDWESAKVAIDTCLDKFPNSKTCLIDNAQVLLMNGSNEEQQKAIQGCLKAYPNDLQCRNTFATYSFMHGDHATALQQYLDMVRDNGSYGTTFEISYLNYQIGLSYRGLGQMEEAKQYLQLSCQQGYPAACGQDEE